MDIFKAVVDWIVAQINAFWSWFLALIPIPPPPSWLTGAASSAAVVMDKAGQLGHWVPWPVLVAVTLTIVVVWGVVLGVKVAKWIVTAVASAL